MSDESHDENEPGGATSGAFGSARRRTIVWSLTGFAVVWLSLCLVTAVPIARSLEGSADEFTQLDGLLQDSDLEAAVVAAGTATREADDAVRGLSRPWHALTRVAPVVGRDARAVFEMSRTARDLGRSMESALIVISDAQASDDVAGVTSALPELETQVAAIATAVREGTDRVVATAPRVGPIKDARRDLLDALAQISPAIDAAADGLTAASWLSGSESPRTVLIAAATPAEQRGAGGFVGAAAVTTIDKGSVEVGSFQTVSQLPFPAEGAVDAPSASWFDRYRKYGGTRAWLNMTMTPDVPVFAEVFADAWQHVQEDRVDGLVIVDPFALQAIVAQTGPIEVPDQGPVDADEIAEYLLLDAYGDFDGSIQRQATLGAVAASALDAFLTEALANPLESTDTVRFAIERGHLRVWSRDEAVQMALERMGAAGALPKVSRGDQLILTANNATATKVDTFLRTAVTANVRLTEGGAARTDVRVDVENAAPTSGELPYVIGPATPGFGAGEMYHLWSVFCGACQPRSGSNSEAEPVVVATEGASTVLDAWVRLQSGDTLRMDYSWDQPHAWESTTEGGLEYVLRWRPLNGAEPTRLTLQVDPGPGFVFTGAEGAERVTPQARSVTLEVFAAGGREIVVGFEREF